MKTLTIQVTAEHIKEGQRANCTKCPIALALLEAVKPARWVSVGPLLLFALPQEPWYYRAAEFPTYVQEFISDFDAGLPVEPIMFEATFVRAGEAA